MTDRVTPEPAAIVVLTGCAEIVGGGGGGVLIMTVAVPLATEPFVFDTRTQ